MEGLSQLLKIEGGRWAEVSDSAQHETLGSPDVQTVRRQVEPSNVVGFIVMERKNTVEAGQPV
ncbi:hypothetical protein AOR01nite_20860 [Acetobacter orleanensis]|uniref:Uncharacterized protein n=1 Tax=Acetobacter orleanensis TaxID=104099 RepID=A0A4Y3TQ75_9PROT|nr:hypothetical protein Abol_247_017 [Acetobacter orleanensis JCM 7639]GEB83609.1 hypothetical protein AOR01nite_20860 [Acetobacter orleanensis]